jgi:hypothetical protein
MIPTPGVTWGKQERSLCPVTPCAQRSITCARTGRKNRESRSKTVGCRYAELGHNNEFLNRRSQVRVLPGPPINRITIQCPVAKGGSRCVRPADWCGSSGISGRHAFHIHLQRQVPEVWRREFHQPIPAGRFRAGHLPELRPPHNGQRRSSSVLTGQQEARVGLGRVTCRRVATAARR